MLRHEEGEEQAETRPFERKGAEVLHQDQRTRNDLEGTKELVGLGGVERRRHLDRAHGPGLGVARDEGAGEGRLEDLERARGTTRDLEREAFLGAGDLHEVGAVLHADQVVPDRRDAITGGLSRPQGCGDALDLVPHVVRPVGTRETRGGRARQEAVVTVVRGVRVAAAAVDDGEVPVIDDGDRTDTIDPAEAGDLVAVDFHRAFVVERDRTDGVAGDQHPAGGALGRRAEEAAGGLHERGTMRGEQRAQALRDDLRDLGDAAGPEGTDQARGADALTQVLRVDHLAERREAADVDHAVTKRESGVGVDRRLDEDVDLGVRVLREADGHEGVGQDALLDRQADGGREITDRHDLVHTVDEGAVSGGAGAAGRAGDFLGLHEYLFLVLCPARHSGEPAKVAGVRR